MVSALVGDQCRHSVVAAGVGVAARMPRAMRAPKPRSERFQAGFDMGRLALALVIAGPRHPVLCVSFYGWVQGAVADQAGANT